MNSSSSIVEWSIALVLFGGLVAAAEIGFWSGRRKHRDSEDSNQLGAIQGAILGLLALLLGFSFSGASERFSGRVQLIVEEANAIGTLWLRIDLLPDAKQAELRDNLRRYVAERIAFYEARDAAANGKAIAGSEALQAQLWAAVVSAAKAKPELAQVLLPPVNEVIDLHGRRVGASQRHLPVLVLLLLLTCSVVAVGAVSYGGGVAGKRSPVLTNAMAFLVAAVLWAIIDLDHPRRGLIQTGQQPMLDLQKSLQSPAIAPR